MGGSTVFPEQVDNRVELSDGIDIIQADDQNDSYASIDAIETFLGPSGAIQAKNIDILGFLESVLPDMKLVWKDVDTVTVKPGRIYCKKADGSIRCLRKNISDVDVTFANIDTGSRATNTTYYVWAVADASATTVTFKISTSSTAPTGPVVIGIVGGFATNATGSGEIINGSCWSVTGEKLLHVRDEKAANTSGGTFTSGAWRTRDLNTVKTNEIAGARLASNQITLPAGTYFCDAFGTAAHCNLHKIRLYNITGSSDLIIGSSEYVGFAGADFTGQSRSVASGRFTLNAESVIELQHYCVGYTGIFGTATNIDSKIEVYAEVKMWRIS